MDNELTVQNIGRQPFWRKDGYTRNYVARRAPVLLYPLRMTPRELAETVTYCTTPNNPYSHELARRAGMEAAYFAALNNPTEQSRVTRAAAAAFGCRLI